MMGNVCRAGENPKISEPKSLLLSSIPEVASREQSHSALSPALVVPIVVVGLIIVVILVVVLIYRRYFRQSRQRQCSRSANGSVSYSVVNGNASSPQELPTAGTR